jgi:hypothetical protein
VRIYFHLKDSQETIPDVDGVEVSGPREARIQALRAIQEFQEEGGRDFSGWTLIATDAAGRSLFTLDLDSVGRSGGV